MPIHVRINEAELRAIFESEDGPVVREVRRLSNRVLNVAKRLCPVDEGRLRASLQVAIVVRPGRVVGQIGSELQYAVYVHEGTGLYGPLKRRIKPVSAKVLAWESRNPRRQGKRVRSRGGRAVPSNMVFAASTAGQKPQPFLTEALEVVFPGNVRRNPTP